MALPTSRARMNWLVRSTCSTRSQSSSVCCAAGARAMVPALLTSMSIAGDQPASCAARSVTAARSAKSARRAVQVRPRARTSFATSPPSASIWALTATMSAPAPASASAMARPMPRRAPVTTARRPVRSNRAGMSALNARLLLGPAVDEDLHDARAGLQGQKGLLRLGERLRPGDQRAGRNLAVGDQSDRSLEVLAVVEARTEQGQLAPEETVQVHFARHGVDRDLDQAASHHQCVDGGGDARGCPRDLEGHRSPGRTAPLLQDRHRARVRGVACGEAELPGEGPAVGVWLDQDQISAFAARHGGVASAERAV